MNKLTFRVHAIQRMFERAITPDEVKNVIAHGEIIRKYPDDTPYPSRLILGWRGEQPLHIVAADNTDEDETIIITVYVPDPNLWESDFRTKRE